MKFYKLTNIGLVRKVNEDALLAEEELGLFGVADGMGGHQAGEVASSLAIHALIEYFKQHRAGKQGEEQAVLRAAVEDANRRVNTQAEHQPHFKGMGTTITVGLFQGGKLQVAHVGDSRAYLLRGDCFTQLTTDHSLVFELVQNGGISEEEAFQHPQRNVLTRALGSAREVEIDLQELALATGDRLLFCTDGLSGLLREEEIKVILQQGQLQKVGDDLLAQALEKGGKDNVSLVLVDVD
jgi:protein phosphatase